jgi:hypothetical protein
MNGLRTPQRAALTSTHGETALMNLVMQHVDVWAASVEDIPGGLANALGSLRDAGTNLQFIIARRSWSEPGKAVMFVAPLRGDQEIAAAVQVGFSVTHRLHAVRVVGRDRPGIVAELTQRLADARINLRGLSVAVIDTQFIAYIALDSLRDANQAIEILQQT